MFIVNIHSIPNSTQPIQHIHSVDEEAELRTELDKLKKQALTPMGGRSEFLSVRKLFEERTVWSERVEIKDIRPPLDISEAMARQMKAERLKRAEILEAEGDKTSSILRAEGRKQSAILEAEGKREAQFRDAEARERAAEAEARATEMVSNAIASSGNQAINYFVAQEYTKAVGKFADSPNAKTILFPVEATNLIGTLGGIGALAGILNMGLFPKMGATFVTFLTGASLTAPGSETTVNLVMSMLIVLVLVYTMLGGMLSVLVTDYLQ